MSKILTIDIGTTACKVIVFDLQGNILAMSNKDPEGAQKVIETAKKISYRLGYVEGKEKISKGESL
ncbi:hypothetical protein [Caldicellulosiruptor naganoensis]|uniref:Carbohydrate kinase FGGY N-terminal domain-containing protein n=1 Tax=Caldicellulosiruptor naganoensis TaxID=29324 RepID=A0ABY7BGZ4_9FIRM|nr:hypothetical protein [Caldicellulosiruptor naganoensis]WAM31346.1 hypothetical protein OTJ99_002196 [Caldicellulosiruptor naganoensis]